AIKRHSNSFKPSRAKRLLSSAGYPNGKGFPTIIYKYSKNKINTKVAHFIAQQLKTILNIKVETVGIRFDKYLKAPCYGKGDLFSNHWMGGYYSPESFLMLGNSQLFPSGTTLTSKQNSSYYKNKMYDKYLNLAKK